MSPSDKPKEGSVPGRRTRAESVRAAIASAEIEGGTISEKTRSLMAEWAEGKITHDELVEAVKSGAQANP